MTTYARPPRPGSQLPFLILFVIISLSSASQEIGVPRLIRYAGTLPSASTTNTARVTNLTFSLFKEQTGGSALWSERQNVEVRPDGTYEVMLGAGSADGLPPALFVSTEARWLGVVTEAGEELQRIQLTSSAYALKAGDAATLGGYPASSFLLQNTNRTMSALAADPSFTPRANAIINPGTTNYLAKFLDASTIASSAVIETPTGLGLDIAAPSQRLDILGRIKLRALGSATGGLWLTGSTGSEQLFLGQIGLDSSSAFGIWHGNSWRFALTSAGDLGIGVGITPTSRLDVGGRAVFRSSPEGTAGFWLTSADGVRTLFVGQRGITSSDAFGVWHNNAWRFTIDNQGNVGVGVDPLFRMDILGRMRLRALGTQPAGTWFSGESDPPQLFIGQTDVVASAPLGIMHGGSWRFLLRSDGKIGIGTITPSELLDVAGNIRLSSGGKLVFSDGTYMNTASVGSLSNITSTDPAILVNKSGSNVTLSLADGAITSAKLAPLPPSTISGIAATLGPNQFIGNQAIQGIVAADQLQVTNQTTLGPTSILVNGAMDYGLAARNMATTNSAVAIRAETSSSSGVAISAVTLDNTGSAVGVNTRTLSPAGKGIYAEAASLSGLSFGVHGISRSSQGTGVQGEALSTTGTTFGVVGITSAENGTAAVYAQNNATSTLGASYGVLARNQASSGVAVFAHEQSLTGLTYGVYGRVDSPSGIAGMFMTSASSGNVIVANNASRRIFRLDTTGNVFAYGTFSPNGADFAESVAVRGPRQSYQPGDVMVVDPDHDRQFLLSSDPYTTKVAGVFSTKPGVLGSKHDLEHAADEIPLAMVGIVPCHVTAENGPIHRGDLLVTSSRPGYAMRGTDRSLLIGAVIGKALQDLESGSGTIEIMVALQ